MFRQTAVLNRPFCSTISVGTSKDTLYNKRSFRNKLWYFHIIIFSDIWDAIIMKRTVHYRLFLFRQTNKTCTNDGNPALAWLIIFKL